jgi:hypothetical protein
MAKLKFEFSTAVSAYIVVFGVENHAVLLEDTEMLVSINKL